ncbi:MAG: hypothetical protein ABSH04_04540 [Acidimicrobiales bacterium]
MGESPAPKHRSRGGSSENATWRDAPKGAHEWVSFPDPDYERTWLFDVTFLESRWTCIYGHGCQGVLTGPAPELVQGCCSYGAHLTGAKDARRVQAAAATLTPEQWQFYDRARPRGTKKPTVIARKRSGDLTTRLVRDACIFLNRPGFPGGAGCALHRAALERGIPHLELKPDVCWQLPLRRDDEVDEGGHVTSVIRQWDRRDWDKGGDEFHWWCTESPDAFVGKSPVYEGLEDELVAMVGKKIYKRLVAYLRARAQLTANDGSRATAGRLAARSGEPPGASSPVPVALPHPAVRRR